MIALDYISHPITVWNTGTCAGLSVPRPLPEKGSDNDDVARLVSGTWDSSQPEQAR